MLSIYFDGGSMENKGDVLLIEDDPDIARAISFQLEKEGYHVMVFHDGRQGLTSVIGHVPQIVILDLMLPNLSGEEVCKAIREHDDEKINKIPIIMLTAKNTEVDGIVGRVIGANYYMTKPFSMRDLLQKIKHFSSKKN